MNYQDQITAVITTHPCYSHPRTVNLDAAYASIRYQLPDVDILILADGVRFEQECFRLRYAEFTGEIQRRIDDGRWTARLHCFDRLTHQAGMMRDALGSLITRPIVMLIEQDLTLTKDSYDWSGIAETLLNDDVASVRFSDEALLRDLQAQIVSNKFGVPLISTAGFTSTPFIARADFLRNLCTIYQTGKCYMEYDNGIPANEFVRKNNIKLAVYAPKDGKCRWGSSGAGRTGPDGWSGRHFPMSL